MKENKTYRLDDLSRNWWSSSIRISVDSTNVIRETSTTSGSFSSTKFWSPEELVVTSSFEIGVNYFLKILRQRYFDVKLRIEIASLRKFLRNYHLFPIFLSLCLVLFFSFTVSIFDIFLFFRWFKNDETA